MVNIPKVMISDNDLKWFASAHKGGGIGNMAAELLQLREEKRQAEEARAALSAVYEHYKGGHYNYLGVAKQESDGTLLALYRSVDTQTIFARPASEFFSDVIIHGVSVPRFRVL